MFNCYTNPAVMKAFLKYAIILLLFHSFIAYSQSTSLNGLYAGVELMPSTMMGGGMTRNDVVILFRPDGTYNDDMGKAGWQKRVSGRYTISGRTVTLRSTGDNRPVSYTLDKDGDISAGSYNLIRQPTNSSIPKGNYEFTSASGSGGGGSGTAYVGSFSNKSLYFDGNGNFANSSQSATAISGETVGGGSSHKSAGSGTYKISNGVLTLNYDNGKTEVHSFFCRPGYKPIMAVIDGNIYFVKDRKGSSGSASTGGTVRGNNKSTTGGTGNSKTATGTNDAKTILLKANAAHGAERLDNVKTLSFKASIQGLKANGYVDVTGKRMRLEVRQSGKLVQVEQVSGNTGWQWQAGSMGQLPAARLAEMTGTFYSGLLGLRKSAINSMSVSSIKQTDAGYTIVAEQDGQRHGFVIGSQSRLIASADQAGKTPTTSAYSDFRTINGILIPFTEVNTSGGQRVSVQYQKFSINPSLPEQTWAKP